MKPDGLGVQWTVDADDPGRGRCIRMDTSVSGRVMVEQWRRAGLSTLMGVPEPKDKPVAHTSGLSYYSDAVPVQSGQPYRVSFDFKGDTRGGKVRVLGWNTVDGKRRLRYESIVNCRGNARGWTRFSQVFHPTRVKPGAQEMGVILHASAPAAVYWFDNVSIEPITERQYLRGLKLIPRGGKRKRGPPRR
jgi:hypothetical protein